MRIEFSWRSRVKVSTRKNYCPLQIWRPCLSIFWNTLFFLVLNVKIKRHVLVWLGSVKSVTCTSCHNNPISDDVAECFCRRVFAASDEWAGWWSVPLPCELLRTLMRTLIKSYRLFLSFSVCHLIILWALAAGCSNGTLDATHLEVLELLFCLCTFEPWRARNRRHYPLRAAVLLYHNCTGAKLHALLVPVPPAGQPCHFVVLRRSSLWCHHQLNRVKLTQSCWKDLWWIKRISKSYIAVLRFFFCRAWESRGPCCTADRECFLSFWRDDYSSPRVHLHWKQVKVEQRAAIFFFFFLKLLNVFGLCFAPLAYTRWLPVR